MTFAAWLVSASLGGCSLLRALDFGGVDEKPFEFRFGWQRGIEEGKGKPGTVDERGVYKPEDPAVEAILSFPDIHASMVFVVQPESRFSPGVAVELFEVKVPWARWFTFQAGGGNQLAYVYAGKRLVSVFEISVGPWFGRDFEEDAWAWGIAGTIIKF